MKFVVAGEVKECKKTRHGWVTIDGGKFVADISGRPVTGCKKYFGNIPTMNETKAVITDFMDKHDIAYNSGDTKKDLITKIKVFI